VTRKTCAAGAEASTTSTALPVEPLACADDLVCARPQMPLLAPWRYLALQLFVAERRSALD